MLRQALPVLLFLLAADGWPQPPLDALPAAKQTVRNALQALAAAPVLPGVGDVVLTAAAPLWRCPALLPLVQVCDMAALGVMRAVVHVQKLVTFVQELVVYLQKLVMFVQKLLI